MHYASTIESSTLISAGEAKCFACRCRHTYGAEDTSFQWILTRLHLTTSRMEGKKRTTSRLSSSLGGIFAYLRCAHKITLQNYLPGSTANGSAIVRCNGFFFSFHNIVILLCLASQKEPRRQPLLPLQILGGNFIFRREEKYQHMVAGIHIEVSQHCCRALLVSIISMVMHCGPTPLRRKVIIFL